MHVDGPDPQPSVPYFEIIPGYIRSGNKTVSEGETALRFKVHSFESCLGKIVGAERVEQRPCERVQVFDGVYEAARKQRIDETGRVGEQSIAVADSVAGRVLNAFC